MCLCEEAGHRNLNYFSISMNKNVAIFLNKGLNNDRLKLNGGVSMMERCFRKSNW